MARSTRASLLVLLAACSEPAGGSPDSGLVVPPPLPPPGIEIDAPVPPAPPELGMLDTIDPGIAPAPPAPAIFTPCPNGWRELADGTCDPWPASGRATCPIGQVHLPGTAGCAIVGSPCPPGPWPVGTPPGAILYVDSAAAPGGTGSMMNPYSTLGEAIASAAPGAVLALARGTYRENLVLTRGVTIIGACAGETIIEGVAPDADLLTLSAGSFTLRDLSFTNGVRAIYSEPAAPATVTIDARGIAISGTTGGGITLRTGAHLEASDVAIQNPGGVGFVISNGASATIERALVEDTSNVGILAFGEGTTATVTDTLVARTGVDPMGRAGYGLMVHTGASLTAARVVTREGREGAISATRGAHLAITDALVEDTLGNASGASGFGVLGAIDATVRASRIRITRCRRAGFVLDRGGRGFLSDAIVEDTLRETSSDAAAGIQIGSASALEADRVRVARSYGLGVLAGDERSTAHFRDLVVHDTLPHLTTSAGVYAQTGATVSVERALLERNAGYAASAGFAGSTLALEDVHIAGTLGTGVLVADGASATIRRLEIEDSDENGMSVTMDSTLALEDAVVRGSGRVEDGTALYVESSDAVVRRALFEHNHSIGVSVLDPGATLELEDVIVRDTISLEQPYGHGLQIGNGATATVRKMIIAATSGSAIYATSTSAATLEDVIIRDTSAAFAEHGGGFGLVADYRASVTMRRAILSGNQTIGVTAADEGTIVELEDVELLDTRAGPNGRFGYGLQVADAARAVLRRVRAERNTSGGIIAADGALDAEDLRIADTQPGSTGRVLGDGLVVAGVSASRVLRGSFERNRTYGIVAVGAQASLDLAEVEVRDTLAVECNSPETCVTPVGFGVTAAESAHVALQRFVITGSKLAALFVVRGGEMDARDGEVFGNTIGASTSEGFDVARIQPDVRYFDNDVDLDSAELPIPELPGSLPLDPSER